MNNVLRITLLSLLLAGAAQARIWTTTTGKMVEADMVKANYTHVLLKAGEKASKVPISLLCEEDQVYIRSKLSDQQQAKAPAATPQADRFADQARAALADIQSEKSAQESAAAAQLAKDKAAFKSRMAANKAARAAKACST